MANKRMMNDLDFFTVYMDAVNSQKLNIPLAFLERVDGNLRITSELEGPAGRSWKVDATKIESDIYFTGGWEDFVKGNNLESGDFLIFSYDGNSRFKVQIYGANRCIKHDSTAKECDALAVQEISRGSLITSFQVEICPSNKSKCLLNIPAEFGNRFMKKGQRLEKWATLKTCKGSWQVKAISCDRLRFLKGWAKFYKGNALQVGDMCDFELIDEEKFIFEVNIQRNRKFPMFIQFD